MDKKDFFGPFFSKKIHFFLLFFKFFSNQIRTVKARFAQGLDSSVFRICNKP